MLKNSESGKNSWGEGGIAKSQTFPLLNPRLCTVGWSQFFQNAKNRRRKEKNVRWQASLSNTPFDHKYPVNMGSVCYAMAQTNRQMDIAERG